MPWRDSPNRPHLWRAGCLWIVLALSWSAKVPGEDFTNRDYREMDSLWSEDFPKVQTRVLWGWPEFLTAPWLSFDREETQSVSLAPPKSTFGKLFGDLDWFSPIQPSQAISVSTEPVLIRADNAGLGSFLFPEWAAAPEYQVTLVRGGTPQLFGGRGRIRGEYGDQFNDVKRIRGQLLLNLIANHIGIDTSVNSWRDKRPAPRGLGDFWTGDANLVYSMGSQLIAMRGGAGAAWVRDKNLDVGYNTTYGADLFLTRPWLLSAELDYGKINNEKLLHWRGTFGVQLLMFELYVGYDSYHWDRYRFDGPVAGAGLWF
jgi:hypothetical protein